MPGGCLAERARVGEQRRNALVASRGVIAVDEIPERIERDVLAERHSERKPSAVHGEPLPDRVVGETENRSVHAVERETGGAPPASAGYGLSEHCHVGVVAAEESPVDGLEEAPDRRGDGACSCRMQCLTDRPAHALEIVGA